MLSRRWEEVIKMTMHFIHSAHVSLKYLEKLITGNKYSRKIEQVQKKIIEGADRKWKVGS